MAEQQATMSLPMDLIRPAIEAKINQAVIEALGSTDALIAKIAARIMNQKVNHQGNVSQYQSDNTTPWLTWAVNDITQKAIRDAITAHIGRNAEKIKAAIEAEMRKSKSPLVQRLVTSMAEGLASAAANSYRINVAFEVKE